MSGSATPFRDPAPGVPGARAYLDFNATHPVRPAVRDAVARALDAGGNPSSVHGAGRLARRTVEDARDAVAALVGADSDNVIFTSGGTEANGLALNGTDRDRILVSAVEHPSVLTAREDALTIPVDADGVVDLEALEALLDEDETPALVSVMLANNETGVIQPVADVARMAHARNALVHCDAVQAAGRMAVDIGALGVDMLTLSAHKLGGPQGAGALVLARNVAVNAVVRGGGQEKGRRAGTENVPGIAGFGVAAVAVAAEGEAYERVAALRDAMETRIAAICPDATVFGALKPRLPNTTCVAMPGVAAETQVMALDLAGVAVSAGSACSSGKVAKSHVLSAMNAAHATDAIRISLGPSTTEREIEMFLEAWRALYARRMGERNPSVPAA